MTEQAIPVHVRVLVVEDQEFQRTLLAKMLERLGARRVLQAADGAEALRILEVEGQVDVVISDIDMPGMDGFEFMRRLAGAGSAPAPAVIVTSAIESAVLASVESMAEAYGIRLLGVLPKPLTQQRLRLLLGGLDAFPQAAGSVAAEDEVTTAEVLAGLANDEFEPWFQPKVACSDGRIVGFEALARWRRADGTILQPVSFLPCIEKHDLAGVLTDAMLRKAAAWCAGWRATGSDVSVAVNVSATSLGDFGTADRLTAIVAAQGLQPRDVTLEITESAAAKAGLGPLLENLARLRVRGFGLSIDDFGTGYSSVQQLGRIAFTELKIDRSFVRSAATHEATMIIVRASLRMAREMGLTSVAEGIETAQEWQLFQGLGCDLAQGYFVSPPMEGGEVESWMRRWAARDAAGFADWPGD